MKMYEKEILQALIDIEAQTADSLQEAYKRAVKKLREAVRLLAISETMEKLNTPQADGTPSYIRVYHQQYEAEIRKAIQEPLEELEEEERSIFVESMKGFFEIGVVAAMYGLHKQNVPLIVPVQTVKASGKSGASTGINVTFTGPKVAEWYKYIRRSMEDLNVKTVKDVQRLIVQGKTYQEIARGLAKSMNNEAGATSFKKAYNKAMTIVRTEGGRIRNEAAYNAMLEAKKMGAEIEKQWCATLDGRTRDSHVRVDGELRELEELFSNRLLYPCQSGAAAEEVINCRCVCLSRARWALDEAELKTLQDRAAYFGLDKTKSFEDFKGKYLKAN